MAGTVSPRGAFAIAAHEALVPARYRDLAGVDTWGIGHTHHAGPPDPRVMGFEIPKNTTLIYQEAWEVFQADLADYAADVVRVFGTGLLQHELDGLTSWHFNTGGALTSSAVKAWKAGDKARAVRIIKTWNKVTIKGKKVVSDALVHRRADEANMILHGAYANAKLAVYHTDGAGTVIWRPVETFTWDEWRDEVAMPAPPRPRFNPFAPLLVLLSLFARRK